MNASYDFTDSKVPSLAAIIQRVKEDALFPVTRRASVLSSMRQLADWASGDIRFQRLMADAIPFTGSSLRGFFSTIAPTVVGVSRKRVQNAESDCRFVLRHYGLDGSTSSARLSPSVQALRQLLAKKFERVQISRLFIYLSTNSLEPHLVSDEVALRFRDALGRDWRIKHPDRVWRDAIRAWNRAKRAYGGWPQVELSTPQTREVWGRQWSAFPPSLKRSVDEFFLENCSAEQLFDGRSAPKLAPSTVRTQKECIRVAASALVMAKVEPNTIKGLREVCAPAAFRLALEQLVKKHGGVTSTVGNVAHVLRKIGKYAGVLAPNEISEVQKAHERLRVLLSRRQRPRQDQDQELLNQLDDPRLVDALLMLARRTVKSVVRSGKRTLRTACMIQRALILEIWLCAPLRIKNLVRLRLDEHFFKMTLDKVERIVIRTRAAETKNSEATEHILNDDTRKLLQLYIDVYRPIIDKSPSPWLFPGADGHHKRENTLGTQMATWIRKELGIHFHPHVIRKIVPKLYLDADPSGLEVVRRQLGHKSDQMLRGAYLQRLHRASQRKYLEALESRRLNAFGLTNLHRSGRKDD